MTSFYLFLYIFLLLLLEKDRVWRKFLSAATWLSFMLPRMHFRVANSSRALDDSLLHLSSSAESEACCVCSISRHRTWQEETHEPHIRQRQTWKISSTITVAAAASHRVGGELKLSWFSLRTMNVPSKGTLLTRGKFNERLDLFLRVYVYFL